MAWPGPQEGLGQGGPRLKWAKGRFGSKNDEKVTVLRMSLPIVEDLSGLQEGIFSLFRGTQFNFRKKTKMIPARGPQTEFFASFGGQAKPPKPPTPVRT